jgi:hypothetical protein
LCRTAGGEFGRSVCVCVGGGGGREAVRCEPAWLGC